MHERAAKAWTKFHTKHANLLGKVRARSFRALPVGILLVVMTLFGSLLHKQDQDLNPNAIRKRLKDNALLIEVNDWQARFSHCTKTSDGVRACDEVGEEERIGFPARAVAEKIFEREDGKVNTVKLLHTLTKEDRAFLEEYNVVSLVLPRSVQNSVKMRIGERTAEAAGAGLDVVLSFGSTELLNAGELTLEFDYDEFPWFGPADLPAAFVEKDAAVEYAALPLRQLSTSNLSRQMEIGLPLMLAAMAIVLDHSIVFGWLSLLSGARAARAYIPFLVETGTALTPELELLAYAVNGLCFAFLVLFVIEIGNVVRVRARWKLLFVAVSVAGFMLACKLDSDFWLHADLWSDFLGALVAAPLCVVGLWRHFTAKKAEARADKSGSGEEASLVSQAITVARITLVLVPVLLYAWANGSELFLSERSTDAFKNTLDWKHSAILPCFVTAALLDVGSIARKMLTFGKEMAAKALIERELLVGKEVQHRMLPVRRRKTPLWSWRSFYFPAQALAGDWYDVRELKFADGRILLAACVADVTGHGVGSSLATSVICSHWSLWCSDAMKGLAPASKLERESLLTTAPRRINDGLLALPQNEQCTAIFALIDPVAREITFGSCGHPGIIVSDGSSLRYLTSTGERLGASGVDSPVWNAKTEGLVPGEIACLYSDGIVPPGDTVSSFAAGLRRRFKKQPAALLPLLWRQFLINRRVFRVQHEIEDDMTLLAIELAPDLAPDPISETPLKAS